MPQARGRSHIVAALGAFLLVASMRAPAQGVMPPTDWLNIKKCVVVLPANPNHDSFVLSGSFNMGPGFVVPLNSDVTLSIGNWSVKITADEWNRKGKSDRYTAKHDRIRAEINYWVGGSSRCDFKFSATGQDLQSQVPSFPEVPVRLQIGFPFNVTAVAMMEQHGVAARMKELGPFPTYVIDRMNARLNQKKLDRDTAIITGRIYMDPGFDPDTDTIVLTIGVGSLYVATIPAGSIEPPARGHIIRHTTIQGDGSRLSLLLNTRNGRIVFWISRADLSVLTTPSVVMLDIFGTDYAGGHFLMWFKVNKMGTMFTY